MARLKKSELMSASDLREAEVDLPSIGGSVLVRGLPAAYSNEASSEALELISGDDGQQRATVNTAKLEVLQALHGFVDPSFADIKEAERFAQNCGPAFKAAIAKIDELSGVDKDALEKAQARFPDSGSVGDGDTAGSGGPDVPNGIGGDAGNDPE